MYLLLVIIGAESGLKLPKLTLGGFFVPKWDQHSETSNTSLSKGTQK